MIETSTRAGVYPLNDGSIEAMTTLSVWKPSGIAATCARLRVKSDAPITSTSDRATCTATRTFRPFMRFDRRVVESLPALIAPARSGRVDRSAGPAENSEGREHREGERERERARIQIRVDGCGNARGRQDVNERAKSPPRDDDADCPAAQTEQRSLRQQLAHEPRACRAQREPNRNLPSPRRGPRHHERRDARARDQHDDRNDAHQQPQRGFILRLSRERPRLAPISWIVLRPVCPASGRALSLLELLEGRASRPTRARACVTAAARRPITVEPVRVGVVGECGSRREELRLRARAAPTRRASVPTSTPKNSGAATPITVNGWLSI